MERRTFLTGVGTALFTSTAVIGTGAFSRGESQRDVTVEIAADPAAYLAMDECPALENDEIDVFVADDGHVEIDGLVDGGSENEFDNALQICNYGKEPAGIWIEAENEYDPFDGGEDRVIFYLEDDPTDRVDSVDDAFTLPVGECVCIGIRVDARGLDNVQLLEGDEIVVHADVDVPV